MHKLPKFTAATEDLNKKIDETAKSLKNLKKAVTELKKVVKPTE